MRDRLYRSRDDRVLFGVCGGVADWLDLDPSLVRIVFALLVLTAGIGFLLYIVMAIVVPEEPRHDGLPTTPEGTPIGGPAAGPLDAAVTPPATGDPAPAAGAYAAAASAPAYPQSSWASDRQARRDARRAARVAGHTTHDGRGAMIFGAILVLLGAWFLIRRYVPALDGDYLGPLVLIAIGVIVLAGALGRSSDDTPRPPR